MRNDRFTESALVVVVQAHREAVSLRTGYIGPEHLLLAILSCRGGIALMALEDNGVTYDKARQKIEEINGPGTSDEKSLGRTTQFEQIYRAALEEALKTARNKIDTWHLLVSLVFDGDNVACMAIELLGVELDAVWQKVYELMYIDWRYDTAPSDTDNPS